MSNRLNSPQGSPSDETPMEFLVRCLDFSGLLEQQDLALFSSVSDNPQFVMHRLIRDGKLSEFQVNEFMNQYDQYRMNWERKRDCFAVIDILVQLGYRTQAQAASYKNAVENLGYRQISAEDFLKRLIAGNKISRGQAQTALNELRNPLSVTASGSTVPSSSGGSTPPPSPPPVSGTPSFTGGTGSGGMPTGGGTGGGGGAPPTGSSGTPDLPLWETHERSLLARWAQKVDDVITWSRLSVNDVTNRETPLIPYNYVLTFDQRSKMTRLQLGPNAEPLREYDETEQDTMKQAEILRVQNAMRTESKIEESEQKLLGANLRIQQLEQSITTKNTELEAAKTAVADAENEWNTNTDDYQEKNATLTLSGASATQGQKQAVIDADRKRRESKKKLDAAKKQQNALETEIKTMAAELEKTKKDADELNKKVKPATDEMTFMADTLRAFNDCMQSIANTTLAIQQVSSIVPTSVRWGDAQLPELDRMFADMCNHMSAVVNHISKYIESGDATTVDTKAEFDALHARIALIEEIAGHLSSKWKILTTSWAQEAGASSAMGLNTQGGMMKRQKEMRDIHDAAKRIRTALDKLRIGSRSNDAKKQAAQEAAEKVLKEGKVNVKGVNVNIRWWSDYFRGNLLKILIASEIIANTTGLPVGLASTFGKNAGKLAWGITKATATTAADWAVPDSWFAEENESTIPPLFNQEHTRQEDIPDL